jgi:hypothetical protein
MNILGEDSITNIWDIRASSHAPVAKIDGYAGVVTSVRLHTEQSGFYNVLNLWYFVGSMV